MHPIKTALLSFGMSGRVFHAPFLQLHPGFELMGSWERSNKTIQQHYPDVISYPTIDTVLSDQAIELVIVNTPTYTHYDYCKQALLAGKDVVVEKAVTTTLSEAIELKELAEKQGRKIAVFQNRRWDSDFKTVQKIVQEGWLGNINEANHFFLHFIINTLEIYRGLYNTLINLEKLEKELIRNLKNKNRIDND
jgi:predicted dehydrogenase